jgi:hypothetical protein
VKSNAVRGGEIEILELQSGVTGGLDDFGAWLKDQAVFEPATHDKKTG